MAPNIYQKQICSDVIEILLNRAGWAGEDLAKRPKGDAVGVGIAMRLRRGAATAMTVAWIAERLKMGSRGAMSNLLNRK